jgi:hypothetical protein
MVGFHDGTGYTGLATLHTIPRCICGPGMGPNPLTHPDTKARCAAMMKRP